MEFIRYARYHAVTLTQRKAAAFARKQEKERNRYPLFSEHVAGEQHDLSEEMTRRQNAIDAAEANMRAFHARTWRKGRAHYFALPDEVKAQVRADWNAWVGPRTSTYFAWMVDHLSGQQAKRVAQAKEETREILGRLVQAGRAATVPLF